MFSRNSYIDRALGGFSRAIKILERGITREQAKIEQNNKEMDFARAEWIETQQRLWNENTEHHSNIGYANDILARLKAIVGEPV